MIQSKEDLKRYLYADKINLRMKKDRPAFFGDDIWKYQIWLRRVEYYRNCNFQGSRLALLYSIYRKYRLGVRLGFSISDNCIGPGLNIAHRGTVIVNGKARIGSNCRIHVCVNIGAGVVLGDNVYIGPGAKLYGNIRIANNVSIGANSVVNKSFEVPGVTIAGLPARVISKKGSATLVRGHID